MGAGGLAAAISDAGPLIHLAEIGSLTLLSVFGALHIPDAVWSETVGQGRVLESAVSDLANVQRHALPQSQVVQFVRQNDLARLQEGERECLCLCQRFGVDTLLTDDLAVREAAKRLNLIPVGSLGIVVRAYRLRRISLSEAERHIADLYDVSSLFVARAIVELAIGQLHERSA